MQKLFRALAWILVAAVVVFTVAPAAWRPHTGAPPHLERFVAIALITAAFCLGYPRRRAVIVVIAVMAVGMLEVMQDVIPGRHGRKVDLAVKVAGALLGGAAAAVIERLKGEES